MYYAHFGLKEAPFKITPHTDFFYAGGNRGAVLDALIYAITHGEGIVKVSGEVGSGKTMLCRMLETRLPDTVETIYLANPSVSPDDILHAIAFELQLPVAEKASRLEVMRALQEHLLARHAAQRQVVIFVEEAQSMPLATLEEIRLLSNLETQHHKLLQIVLFGQPELDTNLSQPQIRQLKERITHSFYLGPFAPPAIKDYLMFRLRAAGYRGPDLFDDQTVREIAKASKGLTRRINIIADKTLLAAFSDNTHTISKKHVRAAVADSEFAGNNRFGRYRVYGWGALVLLMGAAIGYLISLAGERNTASTQPAAISRPSPSRIQSAAIAPAVVKTSPSDLLSARIAATQAWLDSQPGDTYTLQILGAYNQQELQDFLKKLSADLDISKVFVYPTVVKGKPSHTLLYGSYHTQSEAQQALQSLPRTLRPFNPYLRSVQGIRAEIARLR